MEHEKKKRQKKKKNKQGKGNESVSSGGGEPTSQNNNHINATKQNHQNMSSENSDVQNKDLHQMVVDSDGQSISGAESASLELKIKELQEQLNAHLQREADLERNVSQSQKERDIWHHKEADLETRILQLQTEKGSWVQKEKVAAEIIASLNKDNARLQAQVIELEASRNDISHQNQNLKEHVFDLQSKIKDLETSVGAHLSSERTMHVTENDEMKSQLESAQTLVEKLVFENETLVQKVNNLNAKLEQKTEITQSSSLPIKPEKDIIVRNSEAAAAAGIDESGTDPMSSSSAEKSDDIGGWESDKIIESELIRSHSKSPNSELIPISSGEIVQIPLDEKDPTSEASEVGLAEAPLIGAPFRLISFVARYVSGADLVQKDQEM